MAITFDVNTFRTANETLSFWAWHRQRPQTRNSRSRLHQKTLVTLPCIQMFMNGFESKAGVMDLIQTWCDNRYYWTLYFDISLVDIDFDSRSFKVTEVWESKNFCTSFLTKFSVDLNGIWFTDVTWCDEPHLDFIVSIQFSGGRTLHIWFCIKKILKNLLVFRYLQTNSFYDKDHWALHFDISFDYLDCHSRSQLYVK